MRAGRTAGLVTVALVAAALAVLCPQAFAQCAMCKASAAGSDGVTALARTLNFAILVLLIPPVAIFCAIFFAAFKLRKASTAALREVPEEDLTPLTGRQRRA